MFVAYGGECFKGPFCFCFGFVLDFDGGCFSAECVCDCGSRDFLVGVAKDGGDVVYGCAVRDAVFGEAGFVDEECFSVFVEEGDAVG